MSGTDNFTEVWRRYTSLGEEAEQPLCGIAQKFGERLEDLVVHPLRDRPTLGQIAQAKYLLQEEWQVWRKSLPSHHRATLLDKHRCLDALYHETYDRLHLLQLTTRPPVLVVQDYEGLAHPAPVVPSPLPPAISQIAGIFIGEEEPETYR